MSWCSLQSFHYIRSGTSDLDTRLWQFQRPGSRAPGPDGRQGRRFAPFIANRDRTALVPCGIFRGLFGGPTPKEEQESSVSYVDDSDLAFPIEILDETFLRGRELALAYQATKDGWSARDFHRCCDMKGPCVVVGTTTGGARFGGFHSEGFKGSDDYYATWKAFLFCWPTTAGLEDPPIVLKKVGGPEAAVFDYVRGGPQWGADALVIGPPIGAVMGGMAGPDNPNVGIGDLREAKCRLGLAYEKLPASAGQTSLFGGDDKDARLAEILVYYAPDIARLY